MASEAYEQHVDPNAKESSLLPEKTRAQHQSSEQMRVVFMYTRQAKTRRLQFINGRFAAQKPQTEVVVRRNERERRRVNQINSHFGTLRDVLPAFFVGKKKRLSKLQILQSAANYIHLLGCLLSEDDSQRRVGAQVESEHASYPCCPNAGEPHHPFPGTSDSQQQQERHPRNPDPLILQDSLFDDFSPCLQRTEINQLPRGLELYSVATSSAPEQRKTFPRDDLPTQPWGHYAARCCFDADFDAAVFEDKIPTEQWPSVNISR